MSIAGDAVALGRAQSLAHLDGNLTGQTNVSSDLIGKAFADVAIVLAPGCVAVLGVAGISYGNVSRELTPRRESARGGADTGLGCACGRTPSGFC
jgi:hypothetical protein